MHRIQALVTLPDSIEQLARELESRSPSAAEMLVIDALRFHAIALAESIEAHRLIADGLESRRHRVADA